jgi:hypothetical protein
MRASRRNIRAVAYYEGPHLESLYPDAQCRKSLTIEAWPGRVELQDVWNRGPILPLAPTVARELAALLNEAADAAEEEA